MEAPESLQSPAGTLARGGEEDSVLLGNQSSRTPSLFLFGLGGAWVPVTHCHSNPRLLHPHLSSKGEEASTPSRVPGTELSGPLPIPSIPVV